jgi:fatty acid desaturase
MRGLTTIAAMSDGTRLEPLSSFRRADFIPAARLRELSRYDPRAMLIRVGFDYGLIGLAIILSERYQHVWTYLLAVMVIGARQVGIGSVALHEGAHYLLFRNRRANDVFARVILWSVLAPLVGITLESYRQRHMRHHTAVNTSADPDYPAFEHWHGSSRIRMAFLYAQLLLGLPFLATAFRQFMTVPLRTKLCELAGIAMLLGGLASGIRVVELFFFYWLIPLATWGFFVNFLRSAAEHSTPGSLRDDAGVPAIFRTAEIINSPFDSIFVTTRGANYHLSHHLYPSVPFYRLKALQRDLTKVEEYVRLSHVTHGYHRYLAEFFGRGRRL